MSELSPWPITVTVAQDVYVTVTGISGNSYVVNNRIGLVSPTVANEDNVDAELPSLWAEHEAAQAIPCLAPVVEITEE